MPVTGCPSKGMGARDNGKTPAKGGDAKLWRLLATSQPLSATPVRLTAELRSEGISMRARRPRGLRRLHRARRVAIGVSAASLLRLRPRPPSRIAVTPQAGPQEQEIGTLHWGPAVIWLRAAQTGQVELFASAGFRSAFVQPVVLSAEDANRWCALLDQRGKHAAGRPRGKCRARNHDRHVARRAQRRRPRTRDAAPRHE